MHGAPSLRRLVQPISEPITNWCRWGSGEGEPSREISRVFLGAGGWTIWLSASFGGSQTAILSCVNNTWELRTAGDSHAGISRRHDNCSALRFINLSLDLAGCHAPFSYVSHRTLVLVEAGHLQAGMATK